MFNVMKTKLVIAVAVLLMAGTALIGASRPAAAQTGTPVPTTPTAQCSAQDMVDATEPATTAEPLATADPVEVNGVMDQQCGDQNSPDAANETVDANDKNAETDNTQQNDGPQDHTPNDGQPETPDANG